MDAVLGQSRHLISLPTLTPTGHPHSCTGRGLFLLLFDTHTHPPTIYISLDKLPNWQVWEMLWISPHWQSKAVEVLSRETLSLPIAGQHSQSLPCSLPPSLSTYCYSDIVPETPKQKPAHFTKRKETNHNNTLILVLPTFQPQTPLD